MFRTAGIFDKLLDKATSNLLMEPDYQSIIQLCDLIRQNDVTPKAALAALKKKLFAPNLHTALYALLALESMVKNCGSFFHEEMASRSHCDTLYELAKTTPHESVRSKLLELIQAWNYAFRKNPKFVALKDTMNAMKADGYKFPTFRESDAMFSADSAPEWADGDVCHRCRVAFSIIQRKHHCRACGQVFCGQCTQKTTTLPKYGIEKEVRVCDSCYDQASKPTAGSKAAAEKQESDLPAEYLSSSLAQQSQTPPRKTDEELREEEELQLALAISQSEAEAKEKEKFKPANPISYKASVDRSPSPVEEATNPELARYLNRSYWETLNQTEPSSQTAPSQHTQNSHLRATSPSAPATAPTAMAETTPVKMQSRQREQNGVTALTETDPDLEDFISTLKSQVEIFINRMKSNSSRGRSIANDTSVQTLFLNITAMHSRLLRYIQQHDDSRLHYERLQDKLTQVKDARAALDDLREEHRDKLRREAEEAERQRQLQMAHKLEIMRKKKQEYLQYQRQLALQRIQEQEREMQMRQEHQKQQYLMGYMGGANQFPPPPPPNSAPPTAMPYYTSYGGPVMSSPQQQPPQSAPQMSHGGLPPGIAPPGMQGPPQQQQQMVAPPGFPNYGVRATSSQPMMGQMPGQAPPPMHQQQPHPQHGANQGMGGLPVMPQSPGMAQFQQPQPQLQQQQQQPMPQLHQSPQQIQQPPQQIQQPQPQSPPESGETKIAELISFD